MLGDLVLDPFAGSGSTDVAAIRLGRDFSGIESAYKYVQVARARLAGGEANSEGRESRNAA